MKNYFLILCLGVSLLIQGQNKLSGVIVDEQNTPLPGVQVFVEELHKGTSTDENGCYELNNLPENHLKLTVSFMGFVTQVQTLQLQQKETILNIVMHEAIFNMDEIIISTPFNKLQSENVMKVDRATLQQLKNSGATTLAKGIASIAGVSTVSTGSGIGKPVIRGLRGNRVLVYTQGIRLENQQFGDEHSLGVNEAGVSGVEVIKGPASLLYGSDALGGVLYFNPEKFADDQSFDLKFDQTYFSNTLGYRTTIGAKQSYNSWKFLVGGVHVEHSDYKQPNKQRVGNTRFRETYFNTGTSFSNKLTTSTLRFSYQHNLLGIPEGEDLQNTSKTPIYPYQDLRTKMLSLNNIIFLPNSKVTTTLGYTNNSRKEFEEVHDIEDNHSLTAPSLFVRLNTFSYDLKWHLPKINKLETIFGVQGMHQQNKNFGEEILIPNALTNNLGIFATAMYNHAKNSFQGGVRFDRGKISTERHVVMHEDEEHIFESIDPTFKNFTVSLGYKTTLFDKIIGRINMATGFRSPNLAELTSNGVHHGTNRFEVGNNNLDSEQNFQSDISMEYNTDHFEIFANGFYNHINKYIFLAPTGKKEDEHPIFEYVQDDAILYGGEFGTHFHPHPLDWLHIKSGFEFVVGKQQNGHHLPLIPAHTIKNTVKAEFDWGKFKNGYASFSLESHFKQSKISAFETVTPGYHIVNFSAGSTLKLSNTNIAIRFNINNLLNKSYYSHLSRLKADGYADTGRNIVIGIGFNM